MIFHAIRNVNKLASRHPYDTETISVSEGHRVVVVDGCIEYRSKCACQIYRLFSKTLISSRICLINKMLFEIRIKLKVMVN